MRLALWSWLLAVASAYGESLAITDVVVYSSASSTALRGATVVIDGNRIRGVGQGAVIPSDAKVVACAGCVVVAGFWNSHVHFTEPKWEGAASQAPEKLAAELEPMLTRSGFTTVVDTASVLANTVALRSRVERGEVTGPRILTAGKPIFPPDGVPYYVKENLPAELVRALAPPVDARGAVGMAEANLDGGADLIKMFTGSWISSKKVLPMPNGMAKAVVQSTHKRRRLVFAHPSNREGVDIAIASGVDVLAHAPDDTRGLDRTVWERAVKRRMSLIPTLQLFSGSDNIGDIRRVVRQFQELGGRLIFGTDTGYLTNYDVAGEYAELLRAGLSWRDVLRMLTESPAALFRESRMRGRVERGMIADLTVLGTDPAADAGAFSNVRYVIREGRVIWGLR